MKTFSVTLILSITALTVFGQIDVGGKVRDKVNQRIEDRTDEAIDKGLDETEEGIKNSSKKKEKSEGEKQGQETKSKTSGGGAGNSGVAGSKADEPKKFESYSKFDFVPGEKVMYYEDFSTSAIGDFPPNWNTDGSGEVVTIKNVPGKWFTLKGPEATFVPEVFKGALPDNFTIEFDLIFIPGESAEPGFSIDFFSSTPDDHIMGGLFPGTGGGRLALNADHLKAQNWGSNVTEIDSRLDKDVMSRYAEKPVRISIWRQKQRIRLYINEAKELDLPKLFPAGLSIDKMRINKWGGHMKSSDEVEDQIYISNFRLAVGAPDMRNKLITEGKLVTRGITFDSGSDKIKPESYGTIKEIADVLKENAAVKVKIVGHTDSDGADAANLDLSKKRAAAVQSVLTKQFGIDASRMQPDGKGESEPAGPNTTPEGKANNRRVEFIKI